MYWQYWDAFLVSSISGHLHIHLGGSANISPRFWAQVLDSIPWPNNRQLDLQDRPMVGRNCYEMFQSWYPDESFGTTAFNQSHLVYLNRLVLARLILVNERLPLDSINLLVIFHLIHLPRSKRSWCYPKRPIQQCEWEPCKPLMHV